MNIFSIFRARMLLPVVAAGLMVAMPQQAHARSVYIKNYFIANGVENYTDDIQSYQGPVTGCGAAFVIINDDNRASNGKLSIKRNAKASEPLNEKYEAGVEIHVGNVENGKFKEIPLSNVWFVPKLGPRASPKNYPRISTNQEGNVTELMLKESFRIEYVAKGVVESLVKGIQYLSVDFEELKPKYMEDYIGCLNQLAATRRGEINAKYGEQDGFCLETPFSVNVRPECASVRRKFAR